VTDEARQRDREPTAADDHQGEASRSAGGSRQDHRETVCKEDERRDITQKNQSSLHIRFHHTATRISRFKPLGA
jgi:hypothetical protein